VQELRWEDSFYLLEEQIKQETDVDKSRPLPAAARGSRWRGGQHVGDRYTQRLFKGARAHHSSKPIPLLHPDSTLSTANLKLLQVYFGHDASPGAAQGRTHLQKMKVADLRSTCGSLDLWSVVGGLGAHPVVLLTPPVCVHFQL
jgi:hypothetical protein